ncbi:MAG: hypothetical protein HRU19_20385 [Pseudobacteriovorax sp.]|nr:hypothetical protein [Pseudobacteriovorax sp.]
MDHVDSPYASLILNEANGISALKKLLALRKAEDSKVTLSYLTKRLEIKSPSYLSEALNGKKVLKPAYIDELICQTKVSNFEARLLKARIIAEARSTKDTLRKAKMEELEQLKKQLFFQQVSVPEVGRFHFSALVMVSFYLFPETKASREQIKSLFPRDKAIEVDRALGQLLSLGTLKKAGDTFALQKDISGTALTIAEGSRDSEKEFLQQAFIEGLDQLEQQYHQSETTVFFSSCTTVGFDVYKAKLEEFRVTMRSFLADLSQDDPDLVVRINIQMYPILKKLKKSK